MDLSNIATQGLSKMGRNHIHLATGLPSSGVKSGAHVYEGLSNVISSFLIPFLILGMRANSAVMIYLDVPKAMEGGITFFLSANGVVLSPGNDEGIIPPEYFGNVVIKGRTAEGETKR